jgi:hypothetical protein
MNIRNAMGAIVASSLLLSVPARGQAIKKQARNDDAPKVMTAAELAELGDPLFVLVLKDKPNEFRFDEVIRLLKGASGTELFFVVDEKIIDPALGQKRRAVVGFKGSNQQIVLNPNVMLSVIFDANAVQPGFIEALGWDDKRRRYNYYQLNDDSGPLSWRFRGTSIDADTLTATQRAGTCLECHRNGGPVMKELPFPWNNWNSFRSQADYLTPGGANHWPIAEGTHLRSLAGAEDLEKDFILPALRQFNARRLEKLIKRTQTGAPVVTGGKHELTDGKRALRSLFETTEYNVTSSSTFSGLHPFPTPSAGPTAVVTVPDTFFLNANLLAGSGVTQYRGLTVSQARTFGSLLSVNPVEYRQLVADFKTKVGGKLGDSSFAWFVPEASHSDNHMADLLVQRGMVTMQFAAAVLAVDLETPVFSTKRAKLLRFVPDTYRFKPIVDGGAPASHPDNLTKTVIAALKAASPAASSPEADFLALLQNPDPTKVLKQRVDDYRTREQAVLANPAMRPAELKRLFNILITRRREALNNPAFSRLNETGNLLFAVP